MKKALFVGVLSAAFIGVLSLAGVSVASASTDATPPTVSLSVGSVTTAGASGPIYGGVYNGTIDVYATVTDLNLENYHFRVVKDGAVDGYTCTALGALFAPENQGYASTTLGSDACGFAFNQSVYTTGTGFFNAKIATLDTAKLAAYGGYGDYWLIIGAKDTAGNRFEQNYLNDPKIKITISDSVPATAGVVAQSQTTAYGTVHGQSVFPTAFTIANGSASAASTTGTHRTMLAKASVNGSASNVESVNASTTSTSSANLPMATDTQAAAFAFSSLMGNWIWLLVAAVLLCVLWYFSWHRNKNQ